MTAQAIGLWGCLVIFAGGALQFCPTGSWPTMVGRLWLLVGMAMELTALGLLTAGVGQ